MYKILSVMAYFEILIFLCSVISFVPSYCKAESENNNKKASLPKFLTELDLSSVEVSAESGESLKTIVKRLAPEKNGEYQVYQVFFGNPDLLKEWLKGAGVTGQPGVDFPALTTIPATSFSCRGLKGGYYADLETNCQVFHICDNGRKISFLCPNGTIFQQSQLICDWWFKVDCSKSAELYEQSSEQLLEEERKRAESRKSKFEYQQSIESGGQQDYYDVQNLSYDGKQNGRIKTYEEPPLENQVQDRIKTSRFFDAGNNFSQENNQRDGTQFHGNNGIQNGQIPSTKAPLSHFTRNTEEGNVNKYSTTSQDFYSTPKKVQNYHIAHRNSNNQEKGVLKRLKFKSHARNNSTSTVSQRVTPSYTESTTFRASSTTPVKESQQFAESAAFVSNRGNRFVENNGNSHQYYYQLYINRETTTRSAEFESTTATTEREDISTQRNDFSFTDATSTPYYETTTPYFTTTTVSPPCNDEATTENVATDIPATTESLQFANSNYNYGSYNYRKSESRSTFSDPNYYNNRNTNGATVPSTTQIQSFTDSYRQNTVTPDSNQHRFTTGNFPSPATASVRFNNFGHGTESPTTRIPYDNQYSRSFSKNPSTASPGYRQNFISSTTEKPYRTTATYQQNTVTEKDLSPYDRSFTYKQGKVMSTLGPYVPFTRNYATSSTSTPRPTPYTPTVPTPAKTLIPKLKYPAPTALSKLKSSRFTEREHALNMLHSLRNLENNVPNLTDPLRGDRSSNISAPPAPSTLHSLALYFSTATENFDSKETTDSSISGESEEDTTRIVSKKSNGTVHVPTNLLTQHTIDSYSDLFKLNDGIENNNVTTDDRFDKENYGDDYNEDLELQQSGGSLDNLRRSNSTRLREIAQVFTHALSAYLLDPDTFKKVLTEIRPTEPPRTTLDFDLWKTTTEYSVIPDYTSSNREKDEVLDFSDDGNDIRQKLTTMYPTTFDPPTTVPESAYDILSTVPSTYYTTPRAGNSETYEPSTNFATNSVTSNYYETTVATTEDTAPTEQGSTSYTRDSSAFYDENIEVDRNNGKTQAVDNQVPTDEAGTQNRVGGFQNNSVNIVTEPYKEERLFATTPISENLVISPSPSPPSLLTHTISHNWSKKPTSKKPEQQLTPPFYESYAETIRKENERAALNPESYSSTPMSIQSVRSTTPSYPTGYQTPVDHTFRSNYQRSEQGLPFPTSRTSYMKFRTVYNNIEASERPTTPRSTTELTTPITTVETTPCSHTETTESFESTKSKEKHNVLTNDHWTSSPAVTHLWETSVFVDPQRINQGLESDVSTTVSSIIDTITGSQESSEYENTPSLGDDSLSSTEESSNESELPPAPQRLSRNKDSPTSFSLLPTSPAAEDTVTPKPLITTRSSITTTITSSVTSTNTLPQETLVTSLLPYTVVPNLNTTENEIAENLFGKLNATSSNTLMRVMKQADNNETVRQLVLLLVRHCNDPVNKTMQKEKEELLNALLRLPVNEFAAEESRNIVAGINQLSVSPKAATRPRSATTSLKIATTESKSSTASPLVTEPIVTTYRSRKSRRFRTTTENSANPIRRSEKVPTSEAINSLQEDQTSASDGRALELLRSLYTIATKWG
ncbi:chitin-binding domain protein thawb [Nomia melanderi]|uniref:chitin-binding domain protein thawb n=1 Tax=Nomia melanderi TaxID=2448451 RepID=UPI0013047967|nr:mucin-2 [Nomia melanderi]